MPDDVKPAHQLAANRRFLMAEDVDLTRQGFVQQTETRGLGWLGSAVKL